MDEDSPNVSNPTHREVVDWIVKFVRDKKPEPHKNVPREELEALVGLKWDDVTFRFALHDAIRQLNEPEGSHESMLFKRSDLLGLVRLSEPDRIAYAEQGRQTIRSKNEWMLDVLARTDPSKLDNEQRKQLDREQLRQLYLRREIERVRSRKWLSDGEPKELT